MPDIDFMAAETDYAPSDDGYTPQDGADEDTSGPGVAGPPPGPDYYAIFGSPDLATLVGKSKSKTAVARQYEARTNSVLKALAISSINAGSFPDAAALLWHGPAFSTAVGTLAESDRKVRHMLDMITAPANPYAMFVLAALPLITQIMRNHESQLKDVPKTLKNRKERKAARQAEQSPPRFTVHLPFGRQIALRFRLRLNPGKILAGFFRPTTTDPDTLAQTVFTDERLLKALRDAGIQVQRAE